MNPAQDKAWRRLIGAARKAAKARNLAEREAAAHVVKRAIVANQKARCAHAGMPWALANLLGAARIYLAQNAAQREASAAGLAAAVSAARVHLEGKATATTHLTRPFRADLDG